MNTIWREIPEEDGQIFYLTREPMAFSDYDQQDAFFSPLIGTDELVAVGFVADGRENEEMRFPRRVHFAVDY